MAFKTSLEPVLKLVSSNSLAAISKVVSFHFLEMRGKFEFRQPNFRTIDILGYLTSNRYFGILEFMSGYLSEQLVFGVFGWNTFTTGIDPWT
ncbi:unnamed protein product [Rhizophagus irregularis]|nr:unnamed protein product [Rhizophagus irregularis]